MPLGGRRGIVVGLPPQVKPARLLGEGLPDPIHGGLKRIQTAGEGQPQVARRAEGRSRYHGHLRVLQQMLRQLDVTADVRQALDGARHVRERVERAGGGQAAEAGAVAAFLEAASGQPAQTFGKPDPMIFQMAVQRANCKASEAVMVGDNYDTDILGANHAGIRSVFVESGNPPNESSRAVPDLIVSDIAALAPLLSAG